MPTAPRALIVTTYLFENPWPVALALAVVGAFLVWRALDGGTARRLGAGLALVLLALGAVGTGWLVTTPGEHARRLTRALVDAAETADIDGAMALFAPDATLALERLDAPGVDRASLAEAVATLDGANRVEQNTVTRLRSATVARDAGVAELTCLTATASSYGNVPSRWLVRARRQGDGSWAIERLVCVQIAGRQPSWGWMRGRP